MTDWDECDAAALRAALSVVEGWDGSLSLLCNAESNISSSSDSSRSRKPTSRSSKAPYASRQRRQEIAALRVEAEELQNVIELEKVLIAASRTKEPTEEETALELEWERLASTQKHERHAAQVENAALRTLLLLQRKNAEQILSVTKRIKLLEEALPVPAVAPFEKYRIPNIDVQRLLQRLESLIPSAVETFSSGSFATEGRQCFREGRFREFTHGVKGVDFEMDAAWVLPFPAGRVAEAVWLHITRPSFTQKAVSFMEFMKIRTRWSRSSSRRHPQAKTGVRVRAT